MKTNTAKFFDSIDPRKALIRRQVRFRFERILKRLQTPSKRGIFLMVSDKTRVFEIKSREIIFLFVKPRARTNIKSRPLTHVASQLVTRRTRDLLSVELI